MALEEYSKAKINPNHTIIPFRDDNGALSYAINRAQLGTKRLEELLTSMWEQGRAKKPVGGSRGFNTRNEKYPLSKTLQILVQEAGKRRLGSKWEVKFKLIIKHICDKQGMSDQLELVEGTTKPADYVLVSVCLIPSSLGLVYSGNS